MLLESIIRARNRFRDFLLYMPKYLDGVAEDLQKAGVDDVVIKVSQIETQHGQEFKAIIDLGQRDVCIYPGIPISGTRVYEIYYHFVGFQGDGFHVYDGAASAKSNVDTQAERAKEYLKEKGITATIQEVKK